MKNTKLVLIILGFIIFMIASLFFFNYIIQKDKENKQKKEESKQAEKIDLSEASNVPTVDAKLGDDMVITQGYLMRYVTKKRSIWYQSAGYVISISYKNGTASINVGKKTNSKEYVTLLIDSDKCKVKKNDYVYFVGTINVGEGSMNLSKIDKEEFKYSSAEEIKIEDLVNNIVNTRNTVFIIQGYMVTDDKLYKLYDSKEDYKKEGRYFTINWKGKFNYTGNQIVYLHCKLDKGYSLKDCIYDE